MSPQSNDATSVFRFSMQQEDYLYSLTLRGSGGLIIGSITVIGTVAIAVAPLLLLCCGYGISLLSLTFLNENYLHSGFSENVILRY